MLVSREEFWATRLKQGVALMEKTENCWHTDLSSDCGSAGSSGGSSDLRRGEAGPLCCRCRESVGWALAQQESSHAPAALSRRAPGQGRQERVTQRTCMPSSVEGLARDTQARFFADEVL